MSTERHQALDLRFERWKAQKQQIQGSCARLQIDRDKTSLDQTEITASVQLLQYIAEQLCKESEQQTAHLITLALQETFDDLDLSLLVEHENKRGQPSVTFLLRDNTTGESIEDELMEAFGGGPVSLTGILLQVISVIRNKKMARILILDEPLSQISAGYQEMVGRLLRKLCDPPPRGLDFKMLVVTHLEVLAAHAHKKYQVERSGPEKKLVFNEIKRED